MKSLKTKILLDTTYMLPIVGIQVEHIERVLVLLRKLYTKRTIEVYYTPFNMFEILGKLAKIRYSKERVVLGLASIKEAFKVAYPTMEGYLKALELRRKGFKDLIDLLLYVTSFTRKIWFLTRDIELIEFLRKQGEDISYVIYEEDFLKKHKI
ncbi:MAG: PIN domain nuclease [Desulfurococcales archaeon ex4484_217_2]|nr:MAG: PIN domain nuclease [Desulfurococcales archaeon ex4484_217_2]